MRIAGLPLLALLLCHASAASSADANPAASYDELLAKLQSGDTAIDYQALRFAYAETPNFDPLARPAVDKGELVRAVNAGDLGEALSLANIILANNYTDMDAHYASFIVYDQRGDQAKADFHRAIVQGLLKSLADSGDGMSENSGIVVVATAEEYSFLGFKGYRVVRQGMAKSETGPVDAFAVTTYDNQGATIYFDLRHIIAKMRPSGDPRP